MRLGEGSVHHDRPGDEHHPHGDHHIHPLERRAVGHGTDRATDAEGQGEELEDEEPQHRPARTHLEPALGPFIRLCRVPCRSHGE